MRALGLDLGSRRIGVAVSDADGTLATPIEVLERSGDRRADHRAVAALVAEWEATVVVVGLPLTLRGEIGPAAQEVLVEVAQLRDALGVEVRTYDERLSTVTAERSLMQQRMGSRARRQVVDMVAAAVVLQSWLDAGAPDA